MGTKSRNAPLGNSGGNGGSESDANGNAGGTPAPAGTASATAATAGTGPATPSPAPAPTASAGKTGQKNDAAINPAGLAGVDDIERDESGAPVLKNDGTPRKKRGRRPGSTVNSSANGPTVARAPKAAKMPNTNVAAVEMLAGQFQLLNMTLAFLTKFPEWNLTDDEALRLASATALAMEQFDYTPDPKIAAMIGLVSTVGTIYGPRVYLYRKAAAEKRATKRPAPAAAPSPQQDGGFEQGPLNWGQFNG